MLQPRDIKEEPLMKTKSFRGLGFCPFLLAWEEPLMLDPIMNDGDPLLRHTKKLDAVAGGVPADGNDFVLPACQSSCNHASIKHPFPVVFSRDSKRSEVVNRGNERAWPGPEHPPIAWHVQHMQSMLPRQARQNALMAKNIS